MSQSPKVEEAAELSFDAGDVFIELLDGEEVALFAFAAGVADHASGAAHQSNGAVAGFLKAAKEHDGEKGTDVETVAGGIEAGVEGAGTAG